MDQRRRGLVAAAGTMGLFSLVQFGSLALVTPFARVGVRPPSDPSNPATSLLYFVGILVATGLMLAAIRLGVQGVIRALVLGTSGLLTWVVGTVLLAQYLPSLPASPIAGALALCLVGVLYVYPEWYVIDVAGVVMGAGAAGLFGITFGVLPAILLLVVLAVYDAVSVYGTEHMLTLADNAMDLRIPVLFVVPTSLSYSFLDSPASAASADPETEADGGDPSGESPGDRDTASGVGDALFIGLGDAVMPTILAVSAAFYLDAPHYDLPVLLNAPALGALVGTLVGLSALQVLVLRGRAHAGLPLLNGGAIAGYLVGATVAGIGLVEALGIGGFL